MPLTDPRVADEIATYIIAQATASHDGRALLDGIASRLEAAGVPIWRIGFSVPSINPEHRGINLTWRRGEGTALFATAHGDEGDAEYERSPIRALVSENRTFDRWALAAGEGCNAFPLLGRLRREGATDYLLHLVGFAPGTIMRGAGLSYATDHPRGFSDADAALIAHHVPALGLAVFRIILSRTIGSLLTAYVGRRASGRVLSGQVRRGQGEIIAAAILLVDLKGFTAVTDHADPLRLVGWLDQHLEALGHDVARNGGEIIKFTGDGFIAIFPAGDRDARHCLDCARALDTALSALADNQALVARRMASGEPALEADVALHFGDVVYGNIGTADRLDFTAIGRAVNEASRIEALCDETGCSILVSDSFARRCVVPLVDLGEFALRGVVARQRLWTVQGHDVGRDGGTREDGR